MWDLIVSVPDHCLSFYLTCRPLACLFFSSLPLSAEDGLPFFNMTPPLIVLLVCCITEPR